MMEDSVTLENRIQEAYLKRLEKRSQAMARYFEAKRLELKETERLGYEEKLRESSRYERMMETLRRKAPLPDYAGIYIDFFA